MRKKAIFILGMHRSGTSAITGMLTCLGAAMPNTLMVPQPDNPKGFFESYAIMALSDKMLEAAGSKWDGWQSVDLDRLGNRFEDEIVAVTQDEFGDAQLIAIKDPRQCRIAPPWFSALEREGYECVMILPYRHALEVAHSLKKRNGMPLARGLLMWLRHVLDAEFFSRSHRRAFVYMPDLLFDWRLSAKYLEQKLDIVWPVSIEDAASLIEEHIDKDMKHHTYSAGDFDDNALLRDWVKTTFYALEGLKVGDDIDRDMRALDEVRGLMDKAAVLLGPVLDEAEALASERGHLLKAQNIELTDLRSRTAEILEQIAESNNQRQALEQNLVAVSQEADEHRQQSMRLAETLHRMEVQFAVLESQNRNLADIITGKDALVSVVQANNGVMEKRLVAADADREAMLALLTSCNKRLDELEAELTHRHEESVAAKAAFAESLQVKISEALQDQSRVFSNVSQKYMDSLKEERAMCEAAKSELGNTLQALEAVKEIERMTSATVQKYRDGRAADFAFWALQKNARP